MSFLKDLAKAALPAIAGSFLGPAAGGLFGSAGITSPFLQRALTSGLGSVLMGGKPKDAILSGIMGGLGGEFMDRRGAAAAMQGAAGGAGGYDAGPMQLLAESRTTGIKPGDLVKRMSQRPGGAGLGVFAGSAPNREAKTLSGDLLKSLGFAGEDEGNLLFKIMNSKLGEGLAAGLAAQLLAGDDDEAPVEDKGSRAFGAGGPGGKIGGIKYEDGGVAYFPRRNGGISPSEGSGTKDDVPAMLTAGEFVMTRDAVKGAGNGNLNKGIQNMYSMMDNFERMA